MTSSSNRHSKMTQPIATVETNRANTGHHFDDDKDSLPPIVVKLDSPQHAAASREIPFAIAHPIDEDETVDDKGIDPSDGSNNKQFTKTHLMLAIVAAVSLVVGVIAAVAIAALTASSQQRKAPSRLPIAAPSSPPTPLLPETTTIAPTAKDDAPCAVSLAPCYRPSDPIDVSFTDANCVPRSSDVVGIRSVDGDFGLFHNPIIWTWGYCGGGGDCLRKSLGRKGLWPLDEGEYVVITARKYVSYPPQPPVYAVSKPFVIDATCSSP